MRYIGVLFSLIFIGYVVYPYARIFQLDSAINGNNESVLNQLIDLEAVSKAYQNAAIHNIHTCFEEQQALMPTIVRENIDNISNLLTTLSQNPSIDLAWIREHITYNDQSLLNALSFAFFESPTRFVIRLGELGQNPIYVEMTLQDWNWRVTGIY